MIHWLFTCLVIVGIVGCDRTPPHALGTLEWDRVNGRAMVSEVITDVYVTEGELVEEGRPLLKLDDRKIQAEIEIIKGQLQQSEWSLKERIAGPRPQAIAEERARVESAEATVTNARQVYERRKELFVRKQISKEQLDWARKDYLNAQARLKERNEALSELLAGTRIEQVEQSRAQVASLNSQLVQLKRSPMEHRMRLKTKSMPLRWKSAALTSRPSRRK